MSGQEQIWIQASISGFLPCFFTRQISKRSSYNKTILIHSFFMWSTLFELEEHKKCFGKCAGKQKLLNYIFLSFKMQCLKAGNGVRKVIFLILSSLPQCSSTLCVHTLTLTKMDSGDVKSANPWQYQETVCALLLWSCSPVPRYSMSKNPQVFLHFVVGHSKNFRQLVSLWLPSQLHLSPFLLLLDHAYMFYWSLSYKISR